MSQSLLLSVRPRFAQALLAGTKTAEIRRRFPDIPAGTAVVIYSSSPEKAVLGTMVAENLIRSTAADIWRDFSGAIGIQESELTEYLEGATECSVLKLTEPTAWANPVPLDELRRTLRIEPPQSFRYLNDRQVAKLAAHGASAEASVNGFPVLSHTHTGVVPALT